MLTVILAIHLMLAIALVAVVLMQRSEGGGLGMGGSGGGLVSSRAAGNILTRTTAILAAGFMSTSLALAILANVGTEKPKSVMDAAPAASSVPAEQAPAQSGPAVPTAE